MRTERGLAAFMASVAAVLLSASLCAQPAGQAPTAERKPAPDKVSADYKLGPGDLVRVSVFGSPELTTEARVSESGKITCPLIGQVSVEGLSAGETETVLANKFIAGNFLRQPQVSILIVEYQSQRITIMGFVAKPGVYSLKTASTLLDALAEAGGVLPETASDQASLVRADGSQTQLDLDALFRGDPRQNIPVAGGDRIYVPRAPQFYIYGQVQKPGQYRLERNMTVSRAISAGGGLTSRGSERRAIVKRRAADGKEREMSLRSSELLQPDDVLYIKESLF